MNAFHTFRRSTMIRGGLLLLVPTALTLSAAFAFAPADKLEKKAEKKAEKQAAAGKAPAPAPTAKPAAAPAAKPGPKPGAPAVKPGVSTAKPGTPAAVPAFSVADLRFFRTEVLPILERKCASCHSHAAGKAEGGLVVDSRSSLLKGGTSGPAVDLAEPAKSLLLLAVGRADEDLAMPPEEPLAKAEVAVLTEWVRRGLPDPRKPSKTLSPFEQLQEKAKDHWAFEPLNRSEPPAGYGPHRIDAYVRSSLAADGMQPAPEADARALVRRAYFDLVGLPPTPAAVEKFAAAHAKNPDAAMAALVDELLASPHYGERWARHWLDLARYSDISGGLDNRNRDTRLPFAYTYRDYVIRAFNSDKPYDRFITEQIAADLVKLDDPRDLAATGFVTVGTYSGTEEERLGERIDTVMQTFQGLTVGCARCHDHKFDAIPTEDYYSLRGVFASSKELGTGKNPERIDFSECPPIAECPDPKLKAQWETAVREAERKFAETEEGKWAPQEAAWRKQTPEYLAALTLTDKELGGLDLKSFFKNKLTVPVLQQWEKHVQMAEKRHDPVFEPWTKLVSLPSAGFAKQAAEAVREMSAPGKGKREINRSVLKALQAAKLAKPADVAAAYGKLFVEVDAEWQKLLAATKPGRPAPTALADADREALRHLLYAPGMPPVRDDRKYRDAFGNKGDADRNKLMAEITTAKYLHPGAPQRAMSLIEGRPANSAVLIRGEPDQRGEIVPRRFLEVLSPASRPNFTQGSGRLELARAIASPTNPLTARVMVNRIWLHHFGRPLVDTPHDFGLQTPRPGHPELLDDLAVRFIEGGWSVKAMHRLILTSKTWRQSSTDHPAYAAQAEKDPENRHVWRQNVRRLEFEPLRDSLLAVAGTLDPTLFGRSEPLVTDPNRTRRTIYAWIDRTDLPPLLSTFDVPNPELTQGQRFETTVTPQALFFMNNPLVLKQARALAASPEFVRLRGERERFEWLFERILQRKPAADEIAALRTLVPGSVDSAFNPQEPASGLSKREMREMLRGEKKGKAAAGPASPADPLDGWERVIHTLLQTNEFVTVL